MPPSLVASRHAAMRSSIPSSTACVWITDELLRDTFERFTSTLLASSQLQRGRSALQCKRHGSSVPGPLEARRRLARRRFNAVSTFRAHIAEPITPSEHTALFGMPRSSPSESILPSVWEWQPPVSSKPRETLSLPAWLTQSPRIYQNPSYPAFDLEQLLRYPSERVKKLTVSEYQDRLLRVETHGQLQQLHRTLANATLEAPFCSSLAFDVLLSKCRGDTTSSSFSDAVCVSDLLGFLQNPSLEHTNGANLAKLVSYVIAEDAQSLLPALRILYDLIDNGLRHSLFSGQALAGLYRHSRHMNWTAWKLGIRPLDYNLRQDILARFGRRIQQQAEVLPPTVSDLSNLIRIARALPNKQDAETPALFILDRVIYGLKTGNIQLSETFSVLHDLGSMLALAEPSFQDNLTLKRLIDIWRIQDEVSAFPAARMGIVQPILRLVNLLPVTRSTISLTYNLIQKHASHSERSVEDLQRSEMRFTMAQSVRQMLLYDRLQPEKMETHSQLPDNSSASSASSSASSGSQPSCLSKLLDALPVSYAQQWIMQTPKSLLSGSANRKRDEMSRTINDWLRAIYNVKNHDWAKRKYSRHPVWKHVLWELSEKLFPSELPALFSRTSAYFTSRIIFDNWIRRAVETQPLDFPQSRPRKVVGDASRNITCRRVYFDSASRQTQSQKLNEDNSQQSVESQQDLQIQQQNNLQKPRVIELQHKCAVINMAILECTHEYWSMKSLHKRHRLPPLSKPYLVLLKTLQTVGLPQEKHWAQLLELASALEQPVLFESLVQFGRRELYLPTTKAARRLINTHVQKYCHVNPGRVLGVTYLSNSVNLSRTPNLLLELISGRNSRVHPMTILKLLWARDISAVAVLSRDHPDRVLTQYRLSRARIDLIHDAALAFATTARFSAITSWKCVLYCLRYLVYNKAPLDARISEACITSGIVRYWKDRALDAVPDDTVAFCRKIVKLVEGEAKADAVMKTVYHQQRSRPPM